MEQRKLNFFSVAIMYVGTIMGAGFASGREAWQFFGVFGSKAYIGIILAGILFMSLGMMVSYIAYTLNTNDMGKIIVFNDNRKLENIVGYAMSAILYTIIISMSAAGGSFLNQQFGIDKAVGGAIIALLVIITVLGDFERISKVFRMVIPLLFLVVVSCSVIIAFKNIEQSGPTDGFKPSSMAPTWLVATFIFISYNMLGMIPMVATASVNSKNIKHGVLGAGLGGIMLAIMTLLLVFALQKDMAYTDGLDLPMLGYSSRISLVANVIYGVVLFMAIYAAATSTYYGFSTKFTKNKYRKYIIVFGAIAGFIFGLSGFKIIVSYLYPIEGYIGIAIIILISISFIRTYNGKRQKVEDESTGIFGNYPHENRFDYPEYIERVTAGDGGESLLIFGSKKTVLYDTGMAYCYRELLENIDKALIKHGRNSIDFILISHSHYDHIGALPYLLEEYKNAKVIGSQKSKDVFFSKGALKTIKRLGESARDAYSTSKEDIIVDGLRVDKVVSDGDIISIGKENVVVLDGKGHTDCSLVYVLEPMKIMFACESTGTLRNPTLMHTAFLKSYEQTIETTNKCKEYGAKRIIAPHYGIIPENRVDDFFNLYIESAKKEMDFIISCRDKGMNFEETLAAFNIKYWSKERALAQPRDAFEENAKIIIRNVLEVNAEC